MSNLGKTHLDGPCILTPWLVEHLHGCSRRFCRRRAPPACACVQAQQSAIRAGHVDGSKPRDEAALGIP